MRKRDATFLLLVARQQDKEDAKYSEDPNIFWSLCHAQHNIVSYYFVQWSGIGVAV